jgi:hypothetical protein
MSLSLPLFAVITSFNMCKYVAVLITPVYLPPTTLKLTLPCMYSLRWNRISLKSLFVVEGGEAHTVPWVGHGVADRDFGIWFPAGVLIPNFLPQTLGFIQISVQCVPSALSPDLDLPEREVDHSYISRTEVGKSRHFRTYTLPLPLNSS